MTMPAGDPGSPPEQSRTALRGDVVVVGGGPAGLAAAAQLAAAGADVVLLEEAGELGGQYYKRRLGAVRARYGDYRPAGSRLIAATRAAGVRCLTGHLVWGVDDDGRTLLASDPRSGATTAVRARACIVATGAYERAIPMPGWQLPGVVTPGHALHLATCERIALGQRVVVAGTGPFLLAAAAAVLRAGGGVRAIVELNTPYRPGRAAAGAIRFPSRLRELAGYAAVLAAGRVAVLQGQRVVAAQGSGRVEAVQVAARAAGNQPDPVRTFDVDGLAVGYGFRPSSELIRLLGADCERDELGDEFPVVDPAGRTSVPHVFVAGETARIAGLRAALASGQLAAAAAAADLGLPPPQPQVLRAARASLAAELRFAALTARLYPVSAADYLAMPDATMVCRCEGVTAGVIRQAAATGRSEVSGVKAGTRAGMGACQGRQCGLALAALAAAATGAKPAGIAARMPIKPVPVSSLLTRTDGEG
jgi:D-hydroxyproline dehydrogenase subunit alpha